MISSIQDYPLPSSWKMRDLVCQMTPLNRGKHLKKPDICL